MVESLSDGDGDGGAGGGRPTAVVRLPVVAHRAGSARERRGRGPRGPLLLPGPLTADPAVPAPSRRDAFDALVLSFVERLTDRWAAELGSIEFGTEEIPQLPEDWTDEPIPFGSMLPATVDAPARIVLFRRPIELRTSTALERAALVNEVLVEHVAELLGRDPSEIDP